MKLTQLIRHFSIRTRMLGIVGAVTIALLAVGGVGLAAQLYARSVNTAFIAHDFTAMGLIAKLRTDMSTVRSNEKDMIIQYENAVEVSKAKDAWTKKLGEILEGAKALQAVLPLEADRAKVGEAMARLDKFKAAFLPVARQLEAMGFDSARVAAAFMARAQPEYDAAQATIETLATGLEAAAGEGSKRLEATATLVMMLLGASVVLALVIITPVALLNMQSICGPIRDAEKL